MDGEDDVGVLVFREARAKHCAAVFATNGQAGREGASVHVCFSSVLGFQLSQTVCLALQVVKHTRNVTLGSITWKKFPDGFPNIFVHDVESIKGCHVVFLASFSQVLNVPKTLRRHVTQNLL